ncbi:MAG: 3-deoxy-7-phosphoheptulonate synthase [Syntrophomonadaceae bacterium]|nr:3-deoxy-7-phosphoheptulonate synthase [Syntrophomonadaceae bacterium]
MSIVEEKVLSEARLALRGIPGQRSPISLGDTGVKIGDGTLVVVAGPCAVEDRVQFFETAAAVKEAGAVGLRGALFKPRTSPYSFQGLGEKGLALLIEARERTGMFVVTEVLSSAEVPLVAEVSDVIQVGSRNMQNFPLLRTLGAVSCPVILKRGLASTIEEWLLAAEYILAGGNQNVILCERGIRTYEKMTRNTLDLGAVALLQKLSSLPVMTDPSHACGRRDLVPDLARAALAAGSDDLMIEVHVHPEDALSDGEQSLNPKEFMVLMQELRQIAAALGRRIATLDRIATLERSETRDPYRV